MDSNALRLISTSMARSGGRVDVQVDPAPAGDVPGVSDVIALVGLEPAIRELLLPGRRASGLAGDVELLGQRLDHPSEPLLEHLMADGGSHQLKVSPVISESDARLVADDFEDRLEPIPADAAEDDPLLGHVPPGLEEDRTGRPTSRSGRYRRVGFPLAVVMAIRTVPPCVRSAV